MELEELNITILFLTDVQKNYDFGNDIAKIQYLCTELEKMQRILPTMDKLNELQKIAIDLEVKFDVLNELSYYFDPLYATIENEIHKEYVKKIREENRRKRDIN